MVGIGANSVDSVHLLPGYPQPFGPLAKMRIRDRHVLAAARRRPRCARARSLGLRASMPASPAPTTTGAAFARSSTQRDIDITDLIIRDAREPVRGHSRGRDHRRSHRAVGSRRPAAAARPRASDRALAAARVVHVDDVDRRARRFARRRSRATPARCDQRHRSDDRATEELIAAVTHADFRAARARRTSPATNDTERRCACCANARRPAVRHAGRPWRHGARRRRFHHVPGVPGARPGHHRRRRRVPRRLHLRAVRGIRPRSSSCALANAAAAVSCTRLGRRSGSRSSRSEDHERV